MRTFRAALINRYMSVYKYYRAEFVGGHTHVRAKNSAEAMTMAYECSGGRRIMGVKAINQ